MSATQDKTQKTTFVYSNLYSIYRKGKEAAKAADVPAADPAPIHAPEPFAVRPNRALPPSYNVLKTENLNAEASSPSPDPVIREYNPAQLLGKRLPKPESVSQSSSALNSLKDNLKNLNDLHARLRFMLQELEDLVKE